MESKLPIPQIAITHPIGQGPGQAAEAWVLIDIGAHRGYRGRYFFGSGSAKDIAVHGWFHGPMLGTVFSF